jgi:hypothetical protein
MKTPCGRSSATSGVLRTRTDLMNNSNNPKRIEINAAPLVPRLT